MTKVRSAKIEVTFEGEPDSIDMVKQEILELVSPDLNVVNVKHEKDLIDFKDGERVESWIFSAEIDLSEYFDNKDAEDQEEPRDNRPPTCNICYALPGMHADDCPEQTRVNPEKE